MFRYLGMTTLCDLTFVMFLLSWFLTRHILFPIAIKSTYWDGGRLVDFVWEPERGHFMNAYINTGFSLMLLSIQVRALTKRLISLCALTSYA